MLELTLSALLNTMSADFCALMEKEKDVVKSTSMSGSVPINAGILLCVKETGTCTDESMKLC